MGSLPTWDCVTLVGGKRCYGDFKACEGLSKADLERSLVSGLSLEHDRSRLTGGLWALAGYDPSVRVTTVLREGAPGTGGVKSWFVAEDPVIELPLQAIITFRKVGDRADTRWALNDIASAAFSP